LLAEWPMSRAGDGKVQRQEGYRHRENPVAERLQPPALHCTALARLPSSPGMLATGMRALGCDAHPRLLPSPGLIRDGECRDSRGL
jgi:hypothetical protein